VDIKMRILIFTITIFFSSNLLANTPTHEVFYCNEGKRPDCSDCKKNLKNPLFTRFLIDKKSNSIMVQEFDSNKKFNKSFLIENCKIFDEKNWICNEGDTQQYWKYKSHQGNLEYLFKDSREYSNIVRVCGTQIK
jgi:hypothetical protein